jgi:hypothetical protein
MQGQRVTGLLVWLVADGWCWFVLREKYCWLVADKPSEQAAHWLAGHTLSVPNYMLFLFVYS